jgi:hypothetical protein
MSLASSRPTAVPSPLVSIDSRRAFRLPHGSCSKKQRACCVIVPRQPSGPLKRTMEHEQSGRDRPDPASVSSEATLSLRRIRAQSRFRGGIRRRPRRPDRENQYFRTYTLGERAAYRGWELRRGCRHAVTKHRRAPQLTNSESRSEKPLRRCWNRRLASLARTVTPILSIHLESSIDLRAGDNRTGVG